jgi:site-specific DNA-methyltransferase (adenine-specific)
MKDVFTTEAAALLLGISPARIRKLIKDGGLPAEKRGRDHFIQKTDLEWFAANWSKNTGSPPEKDDASATTMDDVAVHHVTKSSSLQLGNGEIIRGDALEILPTLPSDHFQMIIADPPYFQVLLDEEWDNTWKSSSDYLDWTLEWVRECKRVLRHDGLIYIFGQLGKREHVWLHTCSMLSKEMQFHDMIIWDRAVGYNERYDSFTPQYEMILVLRQSADSKPYFDKDAVRLQYDEEKIQSYLRDKRYKDKQAREEHLRKGKYATNILRVPSLKGSSKEKIGHPSQKPISLINQLILASSRKGDSVLDPFLGSGTTAASSETLGRKWTGIESNSKYVEISKTRLEQLLAVPQLHLDSMIGNQI